MIILGSILNSSSIQVLGRVLVASANISSKIVELAIMIHLGTSINSSNKEIINNRKSRERRERVLISKRGKKHRINSNKVVKVNPIAKATPIIKMQTEKNTILSMVTLKTSSMSFSKSNRKCSNSNNKDKEIKEILEASKRVISSKKGALDNNSSNRAKTLTLNNRTKILLAI